jgi:L-ascorbate 6-phosphate lactonase
VRAFQGAHETFDYDDELGYAYLGFHISMGDYHLYHAGDTILFDELVDEVKRYPVDLAFLPINGREYQKLRAGIRGNMNYKEAAQFASEINADIVFPSHWGMHPENTEHPGHFVDYSVSRYRYQKIRVMVPGDRLVYIK